MKQGKGIHARLRDHGCAAMLSVAMMGTVGVAASQTLAAPTIVQVPYPSGAMLPTMHPGDMLDIDTSKQKPQRGDIIVFDFPGYLCESEGSFVRSGDHTCANPRVPVVPHYFVMRVVGMPGDRVESHGDHLTLNGKLVTADMVGPFLGNPEDERERLMLEQRAVVFKEHLPGMDHMIARMPNYATPPDLPNDRVPPVVPAGCYFVLGDNRYNATDSRWWGCMPEQNIRGTVVKITRPKPPQRNSTLQSSPTPGTETKRQQGTRS